MLVIQLCEFDFSRSAFIFKLPVTEKLYRPSFSHKRMLYGDLLSGVFWFVYFGGRVNIILMQLVLTRFLLLYKVTINLLCFHDVLLRFEI